MSNEKPPATPFTVYERLPGNWTLTLGDYAVLNGFDTRRSAFGWLMEHFDNNRRTAADLEMDAEEREAHIIQTNKLRQAALLEVDPLGEKPN